jgi:hypothetical protein
MFRNNKDASNDESLDRAAQLIVRAGGIGDEKADEAASAPFLYARLRARIEAERAQQAEQQNGGWFETFKIARRAVLALALVALVAVGAFWFAGPKVAVNESLGAASPDAASVESGPELSPMSACALSATDECAISSEEVLATMFADRKEKE